MRHVVGDRSLDALKQCALRPTSVTVLDTVISDFAVEKVTLDAPLLQETGVGPIADNVQAATGTALPVVDDVGELALPALALP